MKSKILDITVGAMLGAVLLCVQIALSFLPNIELVSLLIILYTIVLGSRALIPIYVFVVLEGFVYGFGIWWINYLYVWAVLFAVTMLFRNVKSSIFWSVISAVYGLFFGFLCAIIYLFMGGFNAAFAYWLSGIPFDIAHCIGNFLACIILFKPLLKLLQKIRSQVLT